MNAKTMLDRRYSAACTRLGDLVLKRDALQSEVDAIKGEIAALRGLVDDCSKLDSEIATQLANAEALQGAANAQEEK